MVAFALASEPWAPDIVSLWAITKLYLKLTLWFVLNLGQIKSNEFSSITAVIGYLTHTWNHKSPEIFFNHQVSFVNSSILPNYTRQNLSNIVIVNSRFLQRPQKRSQGNQVIHRRLSKTKSIGSGSDPQSRAGKQSDGYGGWCLELGHSLPFRQI